MPFWLLYLLALLKLKLAHLALLSKKELVVSAAASNGVRRLHRNRAASLTKVEMSLEIPIVLPDVTPVSMVLKG
ncbi:hypothetical protein FRC09_009139 [Ceratobasidium sp. 395]|nr:hypothetical protein FRC09_009139 [Ceratobasidium sp. 395]